MEVVEMAENVYISPSRVMNLPSRAKERKTIRDTFPVRSNPTASRTVIDVESAQSRLLSIRRSRVVASTSIITNTQRKRNGAYLPCVSCLSVTIMHAHLYATDCLCPQHGLRSLNEHSIDLAILDPPYGITANAWDVRIDMEALFAGLEHAVKPNGAVIFFSQGRFTADLMTGPWATHWRYNMIWAKNKSRNFFHANRMPLRSHEDIVVFYRRPPTYNAQMDTPRTMGRGGGNPRNRSESGSNYNAPKASVSARYGADDRHPTTVLPFSVVNESRALHPTQKPLALLVFLIRSFSNEGDTVLDACMGVGSSGVAAVGQRRHFVGYEINSAYFRAAQSRIVTTWAPGTVRTTIIVDDK